MARNFPLRTCVVSAGISVVFANSAMAYDDDYYFGMVNIFDNQARPILESLLPPSERSIIEDVEIVVWPKPNLPTVLMTGQTPPEIIVSLGFLDGLFQHIDCVLLESSPYSPGDDLCEQYFSYYFKEVLNSNTPHPVPVAAYAFGNNPNLVDQWYSDSEMVTIRDPMMMSALIFAFMHEFGHHVVGFYGDEESLSAKRQIEADADGWAAQTLASMNERPILGAALSFGYIARMENYRTSLANAAANDPNFIQLDLPHPPSRDRVEWSVERYCSQSDVQSDPSLQGPCELIRDLVANF